METWEGCCGIRLRAREENESYGRSRGSPIIEVELERAIVSADPQREIWHLEGEVALPDGVVAYDQRLSTADGDAYLLETGSARVLVQPSQRRLVVQTDTESAALQLVTTMAIPILLESESALVLHACAAVAPGRRGATIICGRAGTGKSSLLVGLIDAGWRAVSEDVSVVDLRAPTPTVWPGPPWVRRTGAGPAASTARFHTPDKTAWDIAPVQTLDAVPVDEILFLESAGGAATEREPLAAAEVVRRLTLSTIWLTDPGRRAAATFQRTASLARSVPSARIRFAVADDWIRSAVAAVGDGGTP